MYFADLYSAMRRAAAGSVLAVAVVDEVERLPDAQLDAELVEDVEHRGRGAAHERVGVDEREVADEDRHPLTEAARLAAPSGVDVAIGEVPVHRVAIAARVGAVHHVVVHERERVHELERGRGVDHASAGSAAAADERAVAERGPQALAARADERRSSSSGSTSAASTAAQRAISASRSRRIRASTWSATLTSAAGNVASRRSMRRRLSTTSAPGSSRSWSAG